MTKYPFLKIKYVIDPKRIILIKKVLNAKRKSYDGSKSWLNMPQVIRGKPFQRSYSNCDNIYIYIYINNNKTLS